MRITTRKPFTPGEILKEEFLIPSELTQGSLADAIGVSRRTINEIVNGKRQITVNTALRLSKFFSNDPQFWMRLQMKTNLWLAIHNNDLKEVYEKIKPFREV